MELDLSVLGLPEKKEEQLRKKGLNSVKDILQFFPRKYYDFSTPANANFVNDKDRVSFHAYVQKVDYINSRTPYIRASLMDRLSQRSFSVFWFNCRSYMYKEIANYRGCDVIVAGKVSIQKGSLSISNPDIFSDDIKGNSRILPVYSKITGMSDMYLRDVIQKCLSLGEVDEPIPEDLLPRFDVITELEMYKYFHNPASLEELTKAKKKQIFDMVYEYAFKLCIDTKGISKTSEFIPKFLTKCNQFIKSLPYELTEDQKEVVSKFVETARKGERINALIQGDVGCGKTVCAFLLMLAMADNGYQSALMAPTGILARQHYNELKELTTPLGLTTVYLGSDLKAAEKRKALDLIKNGDADFVIGTHSLISPSVEFKRLGLTIVDEEHKFGVVQRDNLKVKAEQGVHSISMSATPIPRSLALAVYGNALDIYNISTMPGGRKPVLTEVVNNEGAAYRFMLSQMQKGHQCYIVCPLITAEEKADLKDSGKNTPMTVEEALLKAENFFGQYGFKVSAITGKMKDNEKEKIIDAFKNNETQVLIATTIIEVGVNVPNATVISIENAERYGLAGLHQLRGRVGRSSLQSYCILRSTEKNNPRLSIMCKTTNGFEIAEEDLKIRGTGEITGIKQSGNDEKLTYVLKYPKLFEKIKSIIEERLANN